jgi:hypothetical protein
MDMRKLPPWKRRGKSARPARKLTPEQVRAARERAAAAGRRYPNLVDNMWAARQGPRNVAPRRDPDSFDPDA